MKPSGFYVDPKFCIEPNYLRTQQKKTSKMLLLNAFFVAGPGIEPGTS